MLAPTYLLGTLRPPRPSRSAQALTQPKALPHPSRGRLTTLVPHLPPRYPPPSTTVPVSPSPYPAQSHTLGTPV